MPAFVRALNNVDFPTLGKPTIPHFRLMSIPAPEARKCMRWLLAARRWLAAVLLCTLAGGAAAQAVATRQAPLVLREAQESLSATELARVWIDPESAASVEQVASAAGMG